jgi:cystathionine beta-lyase family protein involved in aluminum resistance
MNRNLNPETFKLADKTIKVVEDHQYAFLIWADWYQKKQEASVLVSIDFHPDTNPPFWLTAYQKAMAKNPDQEESLTRKFQQQILTKMDVKNRQSLEAVMASMRNDEQINTAMKLGIVNDYHMINCMEAHQYPTGHHYLVSQVHFGSLDDTMFEAIDFKEEALAEIILDIDLDYFSKPVFCRPDEQKIFGQLLKKAKLITIARSSKYFEYLKKENFSIDECQQMILDLIEKCLMSKF